MYVVENDLNIFCNRFYHVGVYYFDLFKYHWRCSIFEGGDSELYIFNHMYLSKTLTGAVDLFGLQRVCFYQFRNKSKLFNLVSELRLSFELAIWL